MNIYYDNLIKNVIDLSDSDDWNHASCEWEIIDCEDNCFSNRKCVCGKERLRYLYTIRNRKNGNVLSPIGSSCIKKFKCEDLNYEIAVYKDMFVLLRAIQKNEYISLNTNYFTRNLLYYLYDNDAFKASMYNNFNAENDYYFMLDMFNKHNKDEITDFQERKIKALIVNNIIPFVKARIKIKSDQSINKYSIGVL